MLLAPDLLPLAGAVTLLAIVRAIVGLAINLRALLPPAVALVPFVVMLSTSALVMGDQISRVRFAGYAIAPQLVDDLRATPMSGTTFEATDFTIILPAGWKNVTSGAQGEAARYVAVDDQYGGTYQGRRVIYRQFTAVPRTQGLALIFHFVEPANEQASLAEAASIAATWRIREAPR